MVLTSSLSFSILPSLRDLPGRCCCCSTIFTDTGVVVVELKLLQIVDVCGWEVIVTFGGEEIVTLGAGLHSGDIALASVVRG